MLAFRDRADCCLERLVANSMPRFSFPLPHLGSLPTRPPGTRGPQLPAAVRSRACPGRTPGTDPSPSHAASIHGPPFMVRLLGQPPPAMYQRSTFASMLALPLTVRLTLAVPDNRRCLRQGEAIWDDFSCRSLGVWPAWESSLIRSVRGRGSPHRASLFRLSLTAHKTNMPSGSFEC